MIENSWLLVVVNMVLGTILFAYTQTTYGVHNMTTYTTAQKITILRGHDIEVRDGCAVMQTVQNGEVGEELTKLEDITDIREYLGY